MVLVPGARLTVATTLPLDAARRLLADRLAGGLTRTTAGSGIFDRRTYEGRLDGDMLTLRGPYGYRKWTLLTRGNLVATPTGTALYLAMRLSSGLAILVGSFALPFFSFALIIMCRSLAVLPLVFFQLAFLYGALLLSVKIEAGYIRDLLAEILYN
jgi:hypothetical protein